MRSLSLSIFVIASLSAGGCSLVVDAGRHQGGDGGAVDSGVPSDSGAADAGADTGVDPFHCMRDAGTADAGELTPLLAADVCAALAHALCDGRVTQGCCSTATGDASACERALLPSCELTIGNIVQEPRAAYDPMRGAELVRDAEDMARACDPNILNLLADRSGLVSALDGTGEQGALCTADRGNAAVKLLTARFSCRTGLRCHRARVAAPFTCQPLSDASTPAPACAEDYDCVDGLRCNESQERCANRLDDGFACGDDTDCESLLCSTTCQARTCDSVWCNDPFGILATPTD